MYIHLTGSTSGLGPDLPYMRKIVQVIHECNGEILNNWIEASNFSFKQPKFGPEHWDWREIVRINMDAIERADAIIVEVTSYSFFQGYQIAVALEQHKPVLAISRVPSTDLAISGISSPLLTLKEYHDEDEVEKVVSAFLEKIKVNVTELQLDLALSKRQHGYLNDAARRLNKTRTDTLLHILDEKMKEVKK